MSVKISVLGLLYPNRCTDWGEIWHAKFHPIGATCCPCGAKNLKISLWVNYIPAPCTSRNAAGNDDVMSDAQSTVFKWEVNNTISCSSRWD